MMMKLRVSNNNTGWLAKSSKPLLLMFMDNPPTILPRGTSPSSYSSSLTNTNTTFTNNAKNNVVDESEWQKWGSTSPLPSIVSDIIQNMKILEHDFDHTMTFGGLGGKLKGDFKIYEDKKHRATYQALGDSEKKLHFFSARQIACRLLGSRGYLCQKCWLPLEDCMCLNVVPCAPQHGIRFWLYMHPKDFLRQNNTGKLLWQVFGVQAATLCLYGISEHEEIMWDVFKLAGKDKVWCLYPNKNEPTKSVHDAFGQGSLTSSENNADMAAGDENLNFVLLDGTWNNSAAMFRRLKDRAREVWGEDLSCISLATGKSAMHKLRPQPAWDKTCTAAAAAALLSEMKFDQQSEAVENGLSVLLDALTKRRLRMGRSITRRERHNRDIC